MQDVKSKVISRLVDAFNGMTPDQFYHYVYSMADILLEVEQAQNEYIDAVNKEAEELSDTLAKVEESLRIARAALRSIDYKE